MELKHFYVKQSPVSVSVTHFISVSMTAVKLFIHDIFYVSVFVVEPEEKMVEPCLREGQYHW